MKFISEEQRVALTVVKLNVSGKDSDRRIAKIEFSMAVGLTESAGMPAFLKDAWNAMRKAGSQARETDLEGNIPSQNIAFYTLEKNKSADMELADIALENLRFEKVGNHIFLYFTIEELLGKRLWDWCWYAFLRTVFAAFQECQMDIPKAKGASGN